MRGKTPEQIQGTSKLLDIRIEKRKDGADSVIFERKRGTKFAYTRKEVEQLGAGSLSKGVRAIEDEVMSIGLRNILPGGPRPLDQELSGQ